MAWFKLLSRSKSEPVMSDAAAEKQAAADARAARSPSHRFLREWILPIGVVMAIMAPIRSVVADWNDVPSGSMRPTMTRNWRTRQDSNL